MRLLLLSTNAKVLSFLTLPRILLFPQAFFDHYEKPLKPFLVNGPAVSPNLIPNMPLTF